MVEGGGGSDEVARDGGVAGAADGESAGARIVCVVPDICGEREPPAHLIGDGTVSVAGFQGPLLESHAVTVAAVQGQGLPLADAEQTERRHPVDGGAARRRSAEHGGGRLEVDVLARGQRIEVEAGIAAELQDPAVEVDRGGRP